MYYTCIDFLPIVTKNIKSLTKRELMIFHVTSVYRITSSLLILKLVEVALGFFLLLEKITMPRGGVRPLVHTG